MNTASIHTIPIDVFRDYVMPYTYCPQSTSLCEDIRSYHNTMTTVIDLYRSLYPYDVDVIGGGTSDIYDEAAKIWLSNDINRYLNKNRALLLEAEDGASASYIEFYMRVYQRLYMNHDRELNAVWTPHWAGLPFNGDIKIAIGLLNPTERLDLEEFLRW
jgi:hypothetical protein